MQRAAVSVLVTLATGGVLFAQENATGGEHGPFDTLGPWKIANTLIFAALVGYFIYKKAPAFFNARSSDILKAIQDATGLKMDADLRYSAVDRQMATLPAEMKKLRDQSAVEMGREHLRRRQETEEAIRRIEANADAQIQAFLQGGIRALRTHATDAALDLAAQRLRERAGESLSEYSLHEFTHLVEKGQN